MDIWSGWKNAVKSITLIIITYVILCMCQDNCISKNLNKSTKAQAGTQVLNCSYLHYCHKSENYRESQAILFFYQKSICSQVVLQCVKAFNQNENLQMKC